MHDFPAPTGGRRPSPAATLLSWLALLVIVAGVVAVVISAQRSQAEPPLPVSAPPVSAGMQGGPVVQPTGAAAAPGDAASRLSTFWGVDISWPQCDWTPTVSSGFAIVGVNGGRPFTANPCLSAQVAYAKRQSGYAAYMNLDAPRGPDPTSYGRRAALDALSRARAAGLHVHTMWLDVEVLNHWADPATNVAVMNGAAAALRARHVTPGVYSSVPMWEQITGGGRLTMPLWLATSVLDYRDVQPLCRAGLGGEPAVMAQYVAGTDGHLLDVDVLCRNAGTDVVHLFTAP
jgi:hypothetical protein